MPGQETIQESNSSLPWTKAVGKAWSKEVSGYTRGRQFQQKSLHVHALRKAFRVAKPLILNSDQGCQFTSNEYVEFLKGNNIYQSMDGKSRWADNIMIKR
ncbi:transposase InsO family protein [Pectinatus brassicae]|uniref:Transposase InsO family protein n=1 Tax=Pectinatus brassicae TaxID=862415 RepID=A0A840UXQ9_9FIRM|nr:transposase InsO family protein [Pectinatus brassicae]